MRAIRVTELGGPEVMRLAEVATPEPGPGEVSIDVAYAGVNFADIKARGAGYRVTALPFIPGLDVSGRVRAIGAGVTGLRAGQEVAAFVSGGGYAETVAVSAETVFPLPAGISLSKCAALPTVVPTAHGLLHEVGRLRDGETVLMHGAAGAVGAVVGQMARLGGAGAVYGVVSSKEKAAEALKYGYTSVFVGDDFLSDVLRATEGRGVDLALDPVGGETFARSLAALARFGSLISFGNASGAEPWKVGQAELFPGRSVAGFSVLTLAAQAPRDLAELAGRAFQMVADGLVDVPITAEFPLADAAEAHRLVESRTTTGKLLLRVAAEDL